MTMCNYTRLYWHITCKNSFTLYIDLSILRVWELFNMLISYIQFGRRECILCQQLNIYIYSQNHIFCLRITPQPQPPSAKEPPLFPACVLLMIGFYIGDIEIYCNEIDMKQTYIFKKYLIENENKKSSFVELPKFRHINLFTKVCMSDAYNPPPLPPPSFLSDL